MKSVIKSILAFAGIFVFLLSVAGPAPVSATAFCEGGTITTLQASGVPNLYRLGLKYGVAWPSIAAASGISNVNRVFPDQQLCVPGATTIITTTTTVVTSVTTTTSSTPSTQTSTPAQALANQPDLGRCNTVATMGQPDRGSCILEVIGGYRVIEVVASCEPNTTRLGPDGVEEKCSVTGVAWIRIN